MPDGEAEIAATDFVCVKCGYNLTGAAIGGVCAECGTSVDESLRTRQQLRSCSNATASMVLGIVSLVMCGLLGPVAIALYFRATKEIRRGGYTRGSTIMAQAGLVMGILSTLLLLGALVLGFW